jgi:RNA polymerase sigma-70 factor, ECF subfamily
VASLQEPLLIPPLRGEVQDANVSAHSRELERVYQLHGRRLWRALLAFSGDPEIASDAVSEAFVQALARDGRLRSPEDWVWTAAFKIASGQLKRRSQQAQVLERDASYELPDPVDHLVKALAQISPKQRLAIVLHDYADRPTTEIAAVLGSSIATVHVHLSQGRRRLRTLLEAPDA